MLEQIKRLTKSHAPPDWKDRALLGRIVRCISSPKTAAPVPMVVLVADIRESTALMKEAKDLGVHAKLLTDVFSKARTVVEGYGGWFDKFTGDGFIAYWPYVNDQLDEALRNGFSATLGVSACFSRALPEFRRNSRNVSGRTSICFGLDAGDARFAIVVDDLTILGLPVVGATRMVSAAEPGETVCNTTIGERLLDSATEVFPGDVGAKMSRRKRDTKEYQPQEIYVVEFPNGTE